MNAAEIQQRLVPESYSLPGTPLAVVANNQGGFVVQNVRSFLHLDENVYEKDGMPTNFAGPLSACAAIALWMDRQEKPADLGVDPDTLG